MSERALCPICQSAEHGCSVREEGVSCYGPKATAAPPSTPAARPDEVGKKSKNFPISFGGIVTFPIPPSAPAVACRTCGTMVVWISLPAGGRLPVDAATREAHNARCPVR